MAETVVRADGAEMGNGGVLRPVGRTRFPRRLTPPAFTMESI